MFEIAFTKEGEKAKKIIFSKLTDKSFYKSSLQNKLITLIEGSVILLLFSSIIEYVITIVFTPNSGITFGFPLPFYSFTVNRILFLNLLTNMVFFAIVIYLVGYAIVKEKGDTILNST